MKAFAIGGDAFVVLIHCMYEHLLNTSCGVIALASGRIST